MTKLYQKTIILILGIILLSLCSCSDEIITDEDFVVTLAITTTGTLTNAQVTYRDDNSSLKTETLSVGKWTKRVIARQGFKISLEVMAIIQNGFIEVVATSTSGQYGIEVFTDNATYTTAGNYVLKYSRTL